MWFYLLCLTILGLFGSLSRFTPRIPWNDVTYLFRKERKAEYLAFSNQFMGKFWLGFAVVSFVLLLINFAIPFSFDPFFLVAGFVLSWLVAFVLLQLRWNK